MPDKNQKQNNERKNIVDPVSGESKEVKLVDILKGKVKQKTAEEPREEKQETEKKKLDPNKVLIHTGYRMRNDQMKKLVERLREKHNWEDTKLLEFILTLDSVIEKAMITNNLLEYLVNNPEILQQLENGNAES
ncbi:competence pheromone ComX [Candidatus Dojkabacteria bacterium]|nr:competence pheromone ComX [Candidatus Dojkabacteria bacterium]